MWLKLKKCFLIFAVVEIVTSCSHIIENSLDTKSSTHASDTIPDNKRMINNKDIQPPISQETISDTSVSDLLKNLPDYTSDSYAADRGVFKKVNIYDSYAAINPSAFKKVNVDKYGKRLKAKYQLKLNTDNIASLKHNTTYLDNLNISTILKERLYKAYPDSKYKPELDAAVKNIAASLSDRNNFFINNSDQFEYQFLPMVSDFYFDSNGKFISTSYRIKIQIEIKNINKPIKIIVPIVFRAKKI